MYVLESFDKVSGRVFLSCPWTPSPTLKCLYYPCRVPVLRFLPDLRVPNLPPARDKVWRGVVVGLCPPVGSDRVESKKGGLTVGMTGRQGRRIRYRHLVVGSTPSVVVGSCAPELLRYRFNEYTDPWPGGVLPGEENPLVYGGVTPDIYRPRHPVFDPGMSSQPPFPWE